MNSTIYKNLQNRVRLVHHISSASMVTYFNLFLETVLGREHSGKCIVHVHLFSLLCPGDYFKLTLKSVEVIANTDRTKEISDKMKARKFTRHKNCKLDFLTS